MTQFSCLQLSQTDSIATVTLNLPDKRNVLSLEMMRELTLAFAQIATSDSRGAHTEEAQQNFQAFLNRS